MRTLINLIIKHHFLIVFILLEIISFTLFFNNNNFQKAALRNSINAFSSSINKRINIVDNYLNLKNVNEKLVAENELLRNKLEENFISKSDSFKVLIDTSLERQYRYQRAKVVNNSINNQFNYITINKGFQDGIKEEMAVISSEGIVGIVQGVSNHYSTIIPVINRNFGLSAKLKKNNYFGSLKWNGKNYISAELHEIPYHVNIAIGDIIVTSGYSSIFPENIPVGKITEYNVKQGNFYTIEVKLSTDFKKLSYVYVIDNLLKEEKKNLEDSLTHD